MPESRKPKLGEIIDLRIEKIVVGGQGLARWNGFVIFVPFCDEGEWIQSRITWVGKKYAQSQFLRVLADPSEHRRQAPCAIFTECGGCDWQHLVYSRQLQLKQDFLQIELGPWSKSEIKIQPSPQEFHYRSRIDLQGKDGKWGYFKKETHELIQVHECMIADPEINRQIPLIPAPQGQQKIRLGVGADPSGPGFSQVNRALNVCIQDQLIAWVKEFQFSHWIEFYAGNGNFTFPILHAFPGIFVVAVESSMESVALAHRQLMAESISPRRVSFYCSSTEAFVTRFQMPEKALLFVDPPRTGLSAPVRKWIQDSRIPRWFYLSCNPSTLKGDLTWLQEHGCRYSVARAQGFDLFPQTNHCEVLVELMID